MIRTDIFGSSQRGAQELPGWREDLAALVNMHRRSLNQSAKAAGVDPTALSRYLRGANTLGLDARRRVLRELGINPRTGLLDDSVHQFLIGPPVGDLRRVLARFCRGQLNLVYLGLEQNAKSWTDARISGDADFFAIFAESVRIAIYRHIPPEYEDSAEPLTPESIPQLVWRGAPDPIQRFALIEHDAYEEWLIGTVSRKSFDASVMMPGVVTWDHVKEAAATNGLSPSDILEMIKPQSVPAGGRNK